MNRIFIHNKICNGNIIEVTEQKNYLINVLRLSIGSTILIFNGINGEYIGEIIEIRKAHLLIKVIERTREQVSSEELGIYLAIIKQDKMLLAIDMAVQLGVTSITPVTTEYTQYRDINYEKINKRIIESTEQSNRLDIALLNKTISLKSLLQDSEKKIIWTNLNEKDKTIRDVKIDLFNSILIGPEGGFSEKENMMISENLNFQSIFLGKNILRTETALACAISQFTLFKISKTLL